MRKHIATIVLVSLLCLALPSHRPWPRSSPSASSPAAPAASGTPGRCDRRRDRQERPQHGSHSRGHHGRHRQPQALDGRQGRMAFAYDYHTVWANEGKISELSKSSRCGS